MLRAMDDGRVEARTMKHPGGMGRRRWLAAARPRCGKYQIGWVRTIRSSVEAFVLWRGKELTPIRGSPVMDERLWGREIR